MNRGASPGTIERIDRETLSPRVARTSAPLETTANTDGTTARSVDATRPGPQRLPPTNGITPATKTKLCGMLDEELRDVNELQGVPCPGHVRVAAGHRERPEAEPRLQSGVQDQR